MKSKLMNRRGSFTAESSIAMVCLIFFILFLMSYMGGLYTESLIEESLLESSQTLRAKLPIVTSMEQLSIIEEPLFRKLVKEDFIKAFEKRANQREVFRFGIKELSVDSSESQYISDQDGKMRLTVSLKWQMLFLESKEIEIERSLYCQRLPEFFHVEFPDIEDDKQAQTVYVTNHRSVYHTNGNCHYLRKSKRAIDINDSDAPTRECSDCKKRRSK